MKKSNSFWIKIGTFSTFIALILLIIFIKNNSINNKNFSEFCLGNKQAKHTLVVYFSLECEYCKKFFLNTIPYIKGKYLKNNYLKIVFKEISLNKNDIDFFIFARNYPAKIYTKILTLYYKNHFKTTNMQNAIYLIAKKLCLTVPQKNPKIKKELKNNSMHFVNNISISLPYFIIDNQKIDTFISKEDIDNIISGEIIIK